MTNRLKNNMIIYFKNLIIDLHVFFNTHLKFCVIHISFTI